MFIDACAPVAVLADEPEAERVSNTLMQANKRFTSSVAALETVLALARRQRLVAGPDCGSQLTVASSP